MSEHPLYFYIVSFKLVFNKKGIFEMEKELKFWQTIYRQSCSNYEMFKKWINDRSIVRKIDDFSCWQKVTKNGLRGLRCPRYVADEWPLKDHATLWVTKDGTKIIVCHPYWNYPKTWKQFEHWNNEYDEKCDFEEKLNKLVDWCKNNSLQVKFFKRSESWYYPNGTIMYEITCE